MKTLSYKDYIIYNLSSISALQYPQKNWIFNVLNVTSSIADYAKLYYEVVLICHIYNIFIFQQIRSSVEFLSLLQPFFIINEKFINDISLILKSLNLNLSSH